MSELKNTTKAALAAALGALCAYGVQLLVPVLVLVVVMLLDYATGMAKAWNAGRRRDAVHKNRAFFCREHAADQIQERGLSAAGWTDNGKKFTGHQVKRYI